MIYIQLPITFMLNKHREKKISVRQVLLILYMFSNIYLAIAIAKKILYY